MSRVDSQFEHLFKLADEPVAPSLASHRGDRWSHAQLMDRNGPRIEPELCYLQNNGDFAKLFGQAPRSASVLFTKTATFRARLFNAMGDSAGDSPLLAAFLSGDESAARREIRRSVKQDMPERFAVPPPDPGPRDDDFDDFLSEEDDE